MTSKLTWLERLHLWLDPHCQCHTLRLENNRLNAILEIKEQERQMMVQRIKESNPA